MSSPIASGTKLNRYELRSKIGAEPLQTGSVCRRCSHHCCNQISMNVRHTSHPTENISPTLPTSRARLQSMLRRFRFQVLSGESRVALGHNQDGEVTVVNFSISVLVGR